MMKLFAGTPAVFHACAAATGNARSPRLDRLVASTNKVDVEPDLRRRHASIPDVKCSVVSRRGMMGHYQADSGRPGHTNETGYGQWVADTYTISSSSSTTTKRIVTTTPVVQAIIFCL